MKKSMYNIYIQGKKETAIFNLLTRNIIVISNNEYLNFDKLINDEECKEQLKS
ncbi:radical SAM/SPASM domain-containing protein, partial [Clostridium perfringens]|nr:radical SAM/SPASM domain-containing protein [Clostridium perfringens]